jgi:hypothetical protein
MSVGYRIRSHSHLYDLIAERDRMSECLDEAVLQMRPFRTVKRWPAFDPYRDDPRLTALPRRMGLEE